MTTTTVLPTWRGHATPFTSVVGRVTRWDAASPCEGWTARDVLEHVMNTQRDFLATHGFTLPARKAEDPARAWQEHSEALETLLADGSVAGTGFVGMFGPTTVGETLARFYGFDLLVHRWDLARSQGADERFTEDELARIDEAVDGFGEHAYAPGIFGAPVQVDDGADEQARVLARTGRDVRA